MPNTRILQRFHKFDRRGAAMIVVVLLVLAAHAQMCAFVVACCRRLPRWTDLPRSRINRPSEPRRVAVPDFEAAAQMLQLNHQFESAASTGCGFDQVPPPGKDATASQAARFIA